MERKNLADLVPLSKATAGAGVDAAGTDKPKGTENYMPKLRYVRRTLLPIALFSMCCIALATVFEIIAILSDNWASFELAEAVGIDKKWWGLWQFCDGKAGCMNILSDQFQIIELTPADKRAIWTARICTILSAVVLPVAIPFFFLAYKRSIQWATYGHGVLAVWLLLWILAMALFGTMDMFKLLNQALGRNSNSDYFAIGVLMHITSLVLVVTASIIHWGSYVLCYVVDIYDDYGNLIAGRQDVRVWAPPPVTISADAASSTQMANPHRLEAFLDQEDNKEQKEDRKPSQLSIVVRD